MHATRGRRRSIAAGALALALVVVPVAAGLDARAMAAPSAAQETIDEIISTLKDSIREKNDPMRNRMFFKLRALGPEAVPALVDLLRNDEPGISEYAAFTLGWIAEPSSVPALVEYLKNGNASRKKAALQALGNMAWGTAEKVRKTVHEQAVPEMIPHLSSKEIEVRREAAYGLGLAGDPRAIQHLEKLVSHEDKVLRFLVEEAIERIRSVNKPKK